jgi:hypothetical protein
MAFTNLLALKMLSSMFFIVDTGSRSVTPRCFAFCGLYAQFASPEAEAAVHEPLLLSAAGSSKIGSHDAMPARCAADRLCRQFQAEGDPGDPVSGGVMQVRKFDRGRRRRRPGGDSVTRTR